MRQSSGLGWIAGVLALATMVTGPAFGQKADTGSMLEHGASLYGDPAAPDISGLWLGTLTGIPGEDFAPNRGPADGRSATFWAPWPLPYTPEYQKIYDDRVATAKKGKQLGDNGAKCLPFGLPQMLTSKVYPDEILQTPGQVTLLINSTFPIVIWTDGRPHPADWTPTYNGHSIGHWQGDTLYVDTIGIKGSTSLDSYRNPHSEAIHLQWSIHRVAGDVLHFEITVFDDKAFTEPVTTTNIWHRKSGLKWEVLDDASCFENNRTDTAPEAGFIKF